MKADLIFKRGIFLASHDTGISMRQASLSAGFNANALTRFVNGNNDIKLMTLDAICRKGFHKSFNTIWELGK